MLDVAREKPSFLTYQPWSKKHVAHYLFLHYKIKLPNKEATSQTPKTWKKNTSPRTTSLENNIHNIKNHQNWQNHPIIEEIHNHTHATMSPPPDPSFPYDMWIDELAKKTKEVKSESHKITTKYSLK